MKISVEKISVEKDYYLLQQKLEKRFSSALSQQILDEIKKVENAEHTDDYISVKTISETLEIIRDETKNTLKSLKNQRVNSMSLETELKEDFKRMLSLYLNFQHRFYSTYQRIMVAESKKNSLNQKIA